MNDCKSDQISCLLFVIEIYDLEVSKINVKNLIIEIY